jgi:hypothetical protein
MIFLAVVLLSIGAFAGGVVMVRFRKRRALAAMIPLSIVAVLFRGVLIYTRPLDVALFPFDLYPMLEWWWVAPFAFFLFGAGAGYVRTAALRDALLVAQGLALLYFGFVGWGESFSDLDRLTGRVGASGACMQTSNYSCGAAAAAGYLHSYGINVTECDMAHDCATTQFFGTSLSGMIRGLARRLPAGRGALRVARLDYDGLAQLRRPVLVIVRSTVVDHWIIVDEIGPGEVRVRDPVNIGSRTLSCDGFRERWIGLAAWVDDSVPRVR